MEAALGKSPIPAWDRYGLAALGVAVAVSVGVAIALTPPPVERDVEGVLRLVDHTHPPAAQLLCDFVVRDRLAEHKIPLTVQCSRAQWYDLRLLKTMRKPLTLGERLN